MMPKTGARFSLSLSLAIAAAALTQTAEGRCEPSLEAPTAGSRLVPLFLQAEDGSREFAGWFDTLRSERCMFSVSGDGNQRCLPSEAVMINDLYLDPGCSVPVAAVPRCPASGPYLVRIDPPTCTTAARHHIHTAGLRVSPAFVYQRAGNACLRGQTHEEAMYVTLGAEIAPGSFVAARYATGRPTLTIKTDY
jgi:hypothetical protein